MRRFLALVSWSFFAASCGDQHADTAQAKPSAAPSSTAPGVASVQPAQTEVVPPRPVVPVQRVVDPLALELASEISFASGASRATRTPIRMPGGPLNIVERVRADLGVQTRAVLFPVESDCENGSKQWNLGFVVAREQWLIERLAWQVTDCAGEDSAPTSFKMEARDIAPGSPQELIITAETSESIYNTAGDGTVSFTGERVWICGIRSMTPVCWASFWSKRELTAGTPRQVPESAGREINRRWSIEDGFAPQLVITERGVTTKLDLFSIPNVTGGVH